MKTPEETKRSFEDDAKAIAKAYQTILMVFESTEHCAARKELHETLICLVEAHKLLIRATE